MNKELDLCTALDPTLKGGLHQKKNFFFVSNDTSNDTMKGPESRKFFLKTMKISVTVKIHPLCTSGSERKFQMGPVGRGLRDVTRRQFIKYSTGKLLFLPSGLTIKKQGEWLQRSVLGPPPALARPTDEVSIG